jgi:autotransporter-associated beta strand protein
MAMILTWYRRVMQSRLSRCSRWQSPAARRFFCRPRLETLEDRRTPATHTWTGAVSQYWTSVGNWSGGTPLGDPSADLIFPTSGSRAATTDDFATPINVHSITFSGNGGSIDGTAGASLNFVPGQINCTDNAAFIFPPINLGTSGTTSATITVAGPDSLSLDGPISGSSGNSLKKEGTGALYLAPPGRSNYQGPTLVDAGTLGLVSNNGSPSTAVTVAAGATLDVVSSGVIGSLAGAGQIYLNSGALSIGFDNASSAFSGTISSFGTLSKYGTGTLTLSGTNAYRGATNVYAGALRFGADNAASSSSAVTVAAGATLDLNSHRETIAALSGASGSRVTLGSGTLTISENTSTTFSGVISGAGALDKSGSSTLFLSGINTYSGPTFVDSGTLSFGADNAASGQSEVFVRGGTFDVNGHAETIGPLIGASGSQVTLGNGGSLTTAGLAGNGSINLGNGALTVSDYAFGTWQYAGVISGTGSLYKTGNSTLELDGNNTYTGSTTVVGGGTLLVNGSLSPSSGILVNGATLSGTGTVGRFGTLGSAIIAPGGVNAGTLTTGDATFLGGSTLRVRLNGTSAYDRLNSTGAVDLSNHPNLSVALNFTPAVGAQFTILTASGPITGNFNGLADGQVFALGNARFQIHYTANSVVLTHVADAATHRLISVPATSQAGAAFDVSVAAVDAGGHPDPLYTGTVHFTSRDPYSALLPLDYIFTAADQGQHTFSSGATLFTAGTWDVTATDTASGFSGIAGVQVTPAPASILVLTAPSSTASGSPFDITVTAQDPYGNTDTNYQGTVTFSTSDTDPGVVLPADYSFQPSDQGSMTFARGATLITPGDQTITVGDTISGISGNATVTVTAGPISRDRGNRPLALLPLTAVQTRLPSAAAAPPANAETTPRNADGPSVEVIEARPLKITLGSSPDVRRAPTSELAALGIDLVFAEAQS